MKFVVTVDTEADNQWDGSSLSLLNIKYLPRFHNLCLKYNFRPTYLVAYEVADNREAVKLLKNWQDKGEAEIGVHLHPWTTPPFSTSEKKDSSKQDFPSSLPDELLKEKLKNLTDTILNNFGKPPKSFRAGRWGLDGRVASYLVDLGYTVDCSITPKMRWKADRRNSDKKALLDFRTAPVFPYYLSPENVCSPGNGKLLEVPTTILYTGLFKKEGGLTKHFSSLPENTFKKVLNKAFFDKKWLRILNNSKSKDWINILKSAQANNLQVLEFMIHSSELMPGGSPYAHTEADVDYIFNQLNEMFKLFFNQGVVGITLSEYAEEHKNK
jgi:hypothetical protein